MAAAPLTFLERKWAAGYSSNILHESASQTPDRKSIPALDYDTHRNVSNIGRRVMLSLGRFLFSNFSTVRGALVEQAGFCSSSYVAQYCGRNEAWGNQAEEWMRQHDKIIDVAGQPFNMRLYRRNLILSVLRDGDMGTVLVKTPNGYPMIQCIPSHRIGSRLSDTVVRGGPHDGARIIDGVIVDDQGAPMAYRVMGENPWDHATYTDVSARDMFLSYIPDYVDQKRGWSSLGSCLFDFQDVKEYRQFELLAQKVGAAISLIEKNVEGEAQPGAAFISLPGAGDPTAGTATGLVIEMTAGGTIRYIRSTDPNAAIEAFQNDRPTGNQQAFEDKIVRSAFHGMGWSVDFSLDPSKVGRAEMRLILGKVNRQIAEKQDLILLPACTRIDGFRLSVAVQLGLLDPDVDWWKFDYQGPAKFTADAKNESDMAINEHRSGHRTLKRICADEAEYWEDIQDQLIAEEVRLQAKCKAAGVDPDRIRLLTPNGNSSVSSDANSQDRQSDGPDARAALGVPALAGLPAVVPAQAGPIETEPVNLNIQLNTEQRRKTVVFKRRPDGTVTGADIIETP